MCLDHPWIKPEQPCNTCCKSGPGFYKPANWEEGGRVKQSKGSNRGLQPLGQLVPFIYTTPPPIHPHSSPGSSTPASALISVATIPVSLSLLPPAGSIRVVPSNTLPLPSIPSMLMVDSLHPGSSVGIEPFGVKLFYFPAIPCQTSNEDPRRAICGHERAANRQHCVPESAGCIAQPTSSPATTSSSPSQGSGIFTSMGLLLFGLCSSVHFRPGNSQPPYICQAAHT